MGRRRRSRRKGSTAAAMFHARLSIFVLLAAAATAAVAQDDCPFFAGICPVTLDNTIGCDYHDVNDIYSCQLNCKTIPSCNYFTMFDDAERNQKKCFHFAQCGESVPIARRVRRLLTSATACPRRRPFHRCRGR